jgi:hypothetical protein
MTPDIKRICRIAFPSYKGRKIKVIEVSEVTLSDRFWDGGTRSEWTAVNLETGERAPPRIAGFKDPPNFGGPARDPVVPLPQGFAIVENAIFCGKAMGLTVYLPLPVALPAVEMIPTLSD